MRSNLLNQLKDYSNTNFYPFHMPGHKRNVDNSKLPEFYRYDITEIDGFDNLHQPEGIIDKAQKLAARIYHSEETYFLINGSTSGILSAISAISEQGGKLLIARNCHKAVYHAAYINRMEVCYIYPEYIADYHMVGEISPEKLQEQIQDILSEKDAKIAGVVITSPTYDGISSNVKEIAKLVHSYNLPLVVDQAHGAHFGFHPDYPENAVAEGADIVIHSVHKTLAAPTQTAIIHKNGNLVNSEKLKRYLRIYQSSSPSYLLMSGIEEAVCLLKDEGFGRLEQTANNYKKIQEAVKPLKHIKICPFTEPGKVIISLHETDISGQQLYDILRERYYLQPEMASGNYVTAILTMMDREEGIIRLIKALQEIDSDLSEKFTAKNAQQESLFKADLTLLPKKVMELWDAYTASYEAVEINDLYELLKKSEQNFCMRLEQNTDKMINLPIAAEFVNLYPPGIPILVPGEVIDEDILSVIEQYIKNGYNVQGIENNKIKVVILPAEGENYEKD